ncbi:serine hydrolase domain-containing protein [Pseudomonadota bacterium]
MNSFPYEEADGRRVSEQYAVKVMDAFCKQHQNGCFNGGQLVVRHEGRVVINLAVGEGASLDAARRISVKPSTLFPVYSAGKPMVVLCVAPLKYPHGTFAYMPGEYGWILSALVQKVTGCSLASFFVREFSEPLGLRDMYYCLGDDMPKDIVLSQWLGKPVEMIAGANAASLAGFYDFLLNRGKTRDGVQLLLAELVDAYTQRQVAGWNKSLSTYLSISRGFMRGTLLPSSFGWWNSGDCFGHAGAFSVLAFADIKKDLSVAIVTNCNAGISDFFKRFISLAQLIRRV